VCKSLRRSETPKLERAWRTFRDYNSNLLLFYVYMWKPIKRPKSLHGYEISDSGEIRNIVTKIPHYQYIDSKGYWCIKSKNVEYKTHRLVADHYIRRLTKKLEVHHEDHNKANPNVTNLQVCTKKQHRRLHATTKAPVPCTPSTPGIAVLTEPIVHAICKYIKKGYSYPKIREELHLYNITDDAINKIAIGKNWKHIADQYDITPRTRSCMNSYSDHALEIAILLNRNVRVKEIAEVMGFEIENNTDYQRLFKAATRYKNELLAGKWGLIKKSDADKIIERYINRIKKV